MGALGASRSTIFDGRLLLVAILMGFEAASLRRWTLSRRKWRQVDIVVADDERSRRAPLLRSLDRQAARTLQRPIGGRSRRPPPTRNVPGQPFSKPPPLPQGGIIGLFPEAGSAAMSVAIVDYGSGNLHSAAKAFERAAREPGRAAEDHGDARSRDRVSRRSHRAARRRRLRRLPAGPRCASTACSRR